MNVKEEASAKTIAGTIIKTTPKQFLGYFLKNESYFAIIPMSVLFSVLVLLTMIYLMIRNRHRLTHMYHKHSSRFAFEENSDYSLERGRRYDLDDPTECLLKGRLQIDNLYT